MMCVCRCVSLYLVARESRDHILEPLRWADQKKKTKIWKEQTEWRAGRVKQNHSCHSNCALFLLLLFFFYMFRSVVLFFPLWHGFVVSFLIYSQTVATFRKGVRAVQMVGRASTYQNNPKTKNKQTKNTNWIFFYIYFVFYILWTKLLHSRLPCVEFWIYVILLCPWVPNARKIRNVLKSFF